MRFQFGARGTGRPQHTLDTQSGREQIPQDAGPGSIAGKVGEEVGRLPVGHAGQNQPLDIVQKRVEALAVNGRSGRQGGPNLAGLQLRQHGEGLNA